VDEPVLEDRYGRRTSPRTRLLVIGAIAAVVLAAVGWFGWAAYSSRDSATGEDIGFHVLSDSTVTVTFDVTKPKDKSASCTVQALDSGFDVVGTSQVTIGPSRQSVVRTTATVRTTNRATAGQVGTCSVTG
jgi:hypothetical protein